MDHCRMCAPCHAIPCLIVLAPLLPLAQASWKRTPETAAGSVLVVDISNVVRLTAGSDVIRTVLVCALLAAASKLFSRDLQVGIAVTVRVLIIAVRVRIMLERGTDFSRDLQV